MSHAIDSNINISQNTLINDQQLQSLIVAFTDDSKTIYNKIKTLQQAQQLLQGQFQYVSRSMIYQLYKFLVEFLNEEYNITQVEQKKTFDPQTLYELYTYISNEQLQKMLDLHMAFNERTYLLQQICVQSTINLLINQDIIEQFQTLTDFKDDFKPLNEQQLFYLIITGDLDKQFLDYFVKKQLTFYQNNFNTSSQIVIRHQDALQYTILNNKIHDALNFDNLYKQNLFQVISAHAVQYVTKIYHCIKKLVKKIPEQFIYLAFYILTLIEKQDVPSLQLLQQLIYNNDKHAYKLIYRPLFQLSCEMIHDIKITGELRPIVSIPELYTTVDVQVSNQYIISNEDDSNILQPIPMKQQSKQKQNTSVKEVLDGLKLLNLKYVQFPDIFWYFVMNYSEGQKSIDELKKFVRYFRIYLASCDYLEYHEYIIYQPGKQFESLLQNTQITAQKLIIYILTGANTFNIKIPDLQIEQFIEMCNMFQPTKLQLNELADKELFPRGNNLFNQDKQLDQHVNSILLGNIPTEEQIIQLSNEINEMSRSCFNTSGSIKSIQSAAKYIFVDQFIQQFDLKTKLSYFLKHSGTSSIYYFYYRWVTLSNPFQTLLNRLNHISVIPQIYDEYDTITQLSKNYITKFLQLSDELTTDDFNTQQFNAWVRQKQYDKIIGNLIRKMVVQSSDITIVTFIQIEPIKSLFYENKAQLHSQMVRNTFNVILQGLIEQLIQQNENIAEQCELQITFLYLLLSFFDDEKDLITEDAINDIININEDNADPLKLLLLMQVLSCVNQLFESSEVPHKIAQKLAITEKCLTYQNIVQVISVTSRLRSSQFYLAKFILQEFEQRPNNVEKIICELGPDYLQFIETNLQYFENNQYQCLQLLNMYFLHYNNSQYDCTWMKPIPMEILQSLHLHSNVLINSDVSFLKELNMLHTGIIFQNLDNFTKLSKQQQHCLAFLISEAVQTALNNPYNHDIYTQIDSAYISYEQRLNNIVFKILHNENQAANAVQLLYEHKYYLQSYFIAIKSRSQQISEEILQELYLKYNILLFNKNSLITNDLNQQFQFSMRNSNNDIANQIRGYLIGTQSSQHIYSCVKWRLANSSEQNIERQSNEEVNFYNPSSKIISCCLYDDMMCGIKSSSTQNIKIFYSILYNNFLLDFSKNLNITIAMLVSFQIRKQQVVLQPQEIINYKRLMQFHEFELISSAIQSNNQLMSLQTLYTQDKLDLKNKSNFTLAQEQLVHACQMCIQQAKMFYSNDYEQTQTAASQEQDKAAKILRPDKLLYNRLINFGDLFQRYTQQSKINLNEQSGIQLIKQICTLNNNYYLFYEIISNPPTIKITQINNNNYLNLLIYIKENPDLFYTNLIQTIVYLIQKQINTFTIRLGYHIQLNIQQYLSQNISQNNKIQEYLIESYNQNKNITEQFCSNILEALVRKTTGINQDISFNTPFVHPYHQNRMISKIKFLQIPNSINLVIIYEYCYFYQNNTSRTQHNTMLYQQQLTSQIEVFKISYEDMLQAHILQLTSELINENIKNSCIYDGSNHSIEQIQHYELMKINQNKQKEIYKLIRFAYQRYNRQLYDDSQSINLFLIEYKNIVSIKSLLEDVQIESDLQKQVQMISGQPIKDNPINYIVYSIKKSQSNYNLYNQLQVSYLLDTIIMRYPFSFQYQISQFQNQLVFSSFLQVILGIGDRHLTNIAIIFDDYPKICNLDAEKSLFKGLLQETPETVPFRFTKLFQNCFYSINQFKSLCTILHKTLTSPYRPYIDDFIVNKQLSAYLNEILTDNQALARLTDDAVSAENLSQMYYGWAAPL